MTVWIFLPAFNEQDSLPLLFPKIRKVFEERGQDYRIVVVNDGSRDLTAQRLDEMAGSYPVDVITHPINRGLGETERDGFEYVAARAGDDDVLVRFDCDDTHDPAYIFSMLEKLDTGLDVVNTSRFQPGGGQKGVNGYRAFISYAANVFMKLVFNIPGVKDYSCGFRAYRARVIKDAVRIFGNGFIQLKGLGFTSTLETIVKLRMLGCAFGEVPFVLRYDMKASPSKMVSSITTLGYMTMALLYHWPWGGWRIFYKGLAGAYRTSPDQAVERYGCARNRKSAACQIGG